MNILATISSVIILSIVPSLAQESQQLRLNDAIEAAKKICVVGSRYKFSMNVSGRLIVQDLQSIGTQTTVIDSAVQTGGVLFEREEIRRLVDTDIRKCMAEQWQNVLAVQNQSDTTILGPLGFPPENISIDQIAKNFIQGTWGMSPLWGANFKINSQILGIDFDAQYCWPLKNKQFGRVLLESKEHWSDRFGEDVRKKVEKACGENFDYLVRYLTMNVGAPSKTPFTKTTDPEVFQSRCFGNPSCKQTGVVYESNQI